MTGGLRLGLERFLEEPDAWLKGRRFGLVTTSAARSGTGVPAYVLIEAACPGLLRAVFTPEHGLSAAAAEGEDVPSSLLPSGIPVHSLYSQGTYAPAPATLAGLDLLVVDLPDIGCRYYTYPATMINCMLAAVAAGIPVLVLDRPNPLGGVAIEGPGCSPAYQSLIGPLDTPIVHGLTIAELARFAAAEHGLPADAVEWVPMLGWDPGGGWRSTDLIWYPPSPGATSLAMVQVYPGTCLFEGTNLSEGRGTAAPFEVAGAPWLDGEALARALVPDAMELGWPLPVPVRFTPAAWRYAGTACGGIRIGPPDGGKASRSVAFGVAMLLAVARLHPEHFGWAQLLPAHPEKRMHADLLAGGGWLREAVAGKASWQEVVPRWAAGEVAFAERAAPARLYDRLQQSVSSGAVAGPGRRTQLDCMPAGALASHLVDSAVAAVDAVAPALPRIAQAIDGVAGRLAAGGRMIYVGAGTSGRLGVLDASECTPTFGTLPGQVFGLLAGGTPAITTSVEGAEDDAPAGRAAMASADVNRRDAVIAIAASGTTPYTVAALGEARSREALAIAVVARADTPLAAAADIAIEVLTGEEPLRGSTRLKAGTAHKVVLNALSTGVFARLGYVYQDLMVGVQPTNAKLRTRAADIVAQAAAVETDLARQRLAEAMAVDARLAVRAATLSLLAQVDVAEALRLLDISGGSLRVALAAAEERSKQ